MARRSLLQPFDSRLGRTGNAFPVFKELRFWHARGDQGLSVSFSKLMQLSVKTHTQLPNAVKPWVCSPRMFQGIRQGTVAQASKGVDVWFKTMCKVCALHIKSRCCPPSTFRPHHPKPNSFRGCSEFWASFWMARKRGQRKTVSCFGPSHVRKPPIQHSYPTRLTSLEFQRAVGGLPQQFLWPRALEL